MRKSKIINWNELEVTVKELTVAEMEGLMNGYTPQSMDIVLDRDIPVAAVELSCGLTVDELRDCTPSALEPLYAAVAELNPSLVALMRQLKEVVLAKLKTA